MMITNLYDSNITFTFAFPQCKWTLTENVPCMLYMCVMFFNLELESEKHLHQLRGCVWSSPLIKIELVVSQIGIFCISLTSDKWFPLISDLPMGIYAYIVLCIVISCTLYLVGNFICNHTYNQVHVGLCVQFLKLNVNIKFCFTNVTLRNFIVLMR